ncbi:hypothetical protein CCP2SC5_2810003 [Azospirillaceae bacterium]
MGIVLTDLAISASILKLLPAWFNPVHGFWMLDVVMALFLIIWRKTNKLMGAA